MIYVLYTVVLRKTMELHGKTIPYYFFKLLKYIMLILACIIIHLYIFYIIYSIKYMPVLRFVHSFSKTCNSYLKSHTYF